MIGHLAYLSGKCPMSDRYHQIWCNIPHPTMKIDIIRQHPRIFNLVHQFVLRISRPLEHEVQANEKEMMTLFVHTTTHLLTMVGVGF